jgi:hypothetical protein
MQFALLVSPRPSKEQADVALTGFMREQRSTVQVARVHLLWEDFTIAVYAVKFERMNGYSEKVEV